MAEKTGYGWTNTTPGCTVGPTGRCFTAEERAANQKKRVATVAKLKARSQELQQALLRSRNASRARRGLVPIGAPGWKDPQSGGIDAMRVGLPIGAPGGEIELPGGLVAAPGPSTGLFQLPDEQRAGLMPLPIAAPSSPEPTKITQLGNTTSPAALVRAAIGSLTPTPVNVPGSQMVPVAWTGGRRRRFGGWKR